MWYVDDIFVLFRKKEHLKLFLSNFCINLILKPVSVNFCNFFKTCFDLIVFIYLYWMMANLSIFLKDFCYSLHNRSKLVGCSAPSFFVGFRWYALVIALSIPLWKHQRTTVFFYVCRGCQTENSGMKWVKASAFTTFLRHYKLFFVFSSYQNL